METLLLTALHVIGSFERGAGVPMEGPRPSTPLLPELLGGEGGCFNFSESSRPLTAGPVDYLIQHFVFPVQFLLGVGGNVLNLCVLLSISTKTQANVFLSAMAFADLAFLCCMVPFSLASFKFFYDNPAFKNFLTYYKAHGVGVANMFSAAATWFVLAVSIERFTGVRSPMHTCYQFPTARLGGLIGVIFTAALVLSLHHHFEYRIHAMPPVCSITRLTITYIPTLPSTSPLMRKYFKAAKYLSIFAGIIVPVVLVAILNLALIYYVRKREIAWRRTSGSSAELRRLSRDATAIQKQERRVTLTVIAIVTCFTLTHIPSLIPFIEDIFFQSYTPSEGRNAAISIINNVLVWGKVLNFLLFCTSSEHFRKRIKTLFLQSWLTDIYRRHRYQPTSSGQNGSVKNPVPLRHYQHRDDDEIPKTSTTTMQIDQE